ncbi:Holliday junction branch migration DNA helicase RuvB [Aporhodopirellula aestuarii]|uniref:Holliday junction branch migration complex subunit RuvB n=1 Tax=Aporhodopirellula aestuarii TaxID=2950107 RepID=A0ABT0U2U1_9BACT|nr:Holliday junction branch migration DNA helicase RuvB [Aporhodopirellula aestuarii]MCM2370885.1 Holliday junction branch migration DNA helicase RuvB [Aporhodopirellula aestuarii]
MAREAIYQQSDPERRGNALDNHGPSPIGSQSKGPPGKPPKGAPAASSDQPAPRGETDVKLRPHRMDEMVGQRDVIERLKIAIDAAQSRGEPLGHILFDGPPGLGKTTFATVIPAEMNTTVQMANGAGLRAPKDLLPYLTNVSEGSVLFIDEIHRVPKAVEEYLYTAMEDYRIDVVLGDGVNARTLNLQLKPFTLIGATTRAGMLSAPLRDRFQIREHLGWYTREELSEIVHRNSKKLSIKVDDLSAGVIADRSRSTPRLANNRLLWVRDYAQSKANGKVNQEITRAALDMIGIDALGLDKQDRNYLDTLMRVFLGGPAGLDAIAHTMNVSGDTLEDEVEPFLLRSELLVRTRRGRLATPGAYEHMRRPMPD